MLISAHASDEYVECASAYTKFDKAEAKKYLADYKTLMNLKKKNKFILGMSIVPVSDVIFYKDNGGVEEIEDVQFIKAEITEYNIKFVGVSKYTDLIYMTRSINIEELKDFIKSGKPIEMD